MTLINCNKDLAKFCDSLKSEDFITIDTEFSRNKTYYPQLSLIQICSAKGAVAIDCVNTALNFRPIIEIFCNIKVTKAIHSARQDLEIFSHSLHINPQSLFDTQIAAEFCNHGLAISYEKLALSMLNVQLDKQLQYSDWMSRPLRQKQLEYALNDVVYLREIYPMLMAELVQQNKLAWFYEDMENLAKKTYEHNDAEKLASKVKIPAGQKVDYGLLCKLVEYREKMARKLDIPRGHYIDDEIIAKIANNPPKDFRDLRSLLHRYFMDDATLNEIFGYVQQREHNRVFNQKHISPDSELLSGAKNLLQQKARQYNMPISLIATAEELRYFAAGVNKDARFKHGWRHEIFGKYLMN